MKSASVFRTETSNVTGSGRTDGIFIQSHLRWESIDLLSRSQFTIREAEICAFLPELPVEQFLGRFKSSKNPYN